MKSALYGYENRQFFVHVSDESSNRSPRPLVIVLHALGGNSKLIELMTGFSKKSDEGGFIAAYPNGRGDEEGGLRSWNAGFCCRYAMANRVDDVGFIQALIRYISSEFSVDSNRIYITGMSNGGMMAYKIATELSDMVAAVGVVSGAIGAINPSSGFPMLPQNPSNPVAAIIFHGKQDRLIPFEGGKSVARSGLYFLSVKDAVDFWVDNNKCSKEPKIDVVAEGVIRTLYSGCEGNSDVVLFTLKNGGHTWPGGNVHPSGEEPTRTISATDLMWEFFKAHPKKRH